MAKKDKEQEQPKEPESMQHAAPAKKIGKFEDFWLQTKAKHNLKPAMKIAIQEHFKTLKVLSDPSKYEEALKHFGIR